MSKRKTEDSQRDDHDAESYEHALGRLQEALVRFQLRAIEDGSRTIVVFEGRDTAGKDGVIRRIVEHLSVRYTHVAALPKPNDRERTQWYFQRYVAHLPAAGELTLFNRSWYNRGGVEPVMGFCTPAQHEEFLRDAPDFERMLVESGITLVKFWLDISKGEQAQRLEARRDDPLKALKVSDLDKEAQARWDAYSGARDTMLMRTHTAAAPWTIVHTDKKKKARLNIIRHLLRHIDPEHAGGIEPANPAIAFPFEAPALTDGRLER